MMETVTDRPTDAGLDPLEVDLAELGTDDAEADAAAEHHEADGAGETDGDQAPDRRWWKGDRSVLIVTAIVALGFVLMIRGVLVGVTGDDRTSIPDAIEALNPVPDAVQVLSQTSVFVDLAPNHTGEFVIDGIAIETVNVEDFGSLAIEPGQQVELPSVTIYEPGNATLTFTPGSTAAIEEFAEGEHQVVLRYWLIEDGPQRARTFTWTFNVV